MGTLQLELSHVRHTQNKKCLKCLSDQSHSRFPEESTKEEGEGEEGKDKDAVPLHVRKKKDDDKEEE
jgi:hypothetical protein